MCVTLCVYMCVCVCVCGEGGGDYSGNAGCADNHEEQMREERCQQLQESP